MVARRFDSRALAGLMAIVSVYALVPYVAIQMQGAGYVLNVVSEGRIGKDLGAAIVYGVVLVYVLRSGVLGVGWTNTFQGILMMSMAWVIGLYVPWKLYGGVSEMFTAIGEVKPELLRAPGLLSPTTDEGGVLVRGGPGSWMTYTSQVLVSIIGFTCWPQLFMRAFNAKDERTLRRTVVLYPSFQLFLLPLLFLGFSAVLYALPPGQSDQVVPHMLTQMDLPGIVVGLFIAGALAASMSSGDAIIHTAASVLVRDGVVTCLGAKPSPRQERTWIRVVILLVVVCAYGLAVSYKGSLVGLLLYAYGPIAQFGPVLVATLYWRGATRRGVLAGLVMGSATSLAFVTFLEPPLGLHAGLLGLLTNVLALVFVSKFTREGTRVEGESFLVCAETAVR
jgi:SSS family solute:Na+ symporter